MSVTAKVISVNEVFTEEQSAVVFAGLKLFLAAPGDKGVRKFLILLFRLVGITQKKLSYWFSYTERQIRNIERSFEREGSRSLFDKARPGRPSKVTPCLVGFIIRLILQLIKGGQKPTIALLKGNLKEGRDLDISERKLQEVVSQYGLSSLLNLKPIQIPKAQGEEGLILGHTSFGGGWLLIPLLLPLYEEARTYSRKMAHLFLSIVFCSLYSMGRLFYLKDIKDRGFALLLGKVKVPDDSTVWKWMEKISKKAILELYQKSRPLKGPLLSLWASIDEHVVARWTQIFGLAKTKHPTRGRKMRADKLFYVYDLANDLLLSLKTASGAVRLSQCILQIVRELLSFSKVAFLRILFDAGGYKGSVFARLNHMERVAYLAKAVRYSTNIKQWEKVEEFEDYIPPSDRDLPKEKQRHFLIGECRTKIKGCAEKIRTILIINPAKKGKKRYCGLVTDDEGLRADLADEYLLRFRHESCYRVMVHDLKLDILPKSYSLKAKDRKNPSFLAKRIFLVAWIKAYVYNTIVKFRSKLSSPYSKMTVGRLVRKFIAKGAILKVTSSELWVILDPFKEREALRDYCHWVNGQQIKIPWFKNRILRFDFAQSDTFANETMMRKLLSAT